MWLIAGCIAGVLLLACSTSTAKNVIKVSSVLVDTLKDKYFGEKPKKIEIIDINNKSLVVYEDITLLTAKNHHQYDVICFTSDSDSLNSNTSVHNFEPKCHIKRMIPLTVIRHGQYLSTIPFRPNDFNYDVIFVSIKKMNEDNYSVYKFCSDSYINLIDIIDKYEVDSKANEVVGELAEAYD